MTCVGSNRVFWTIDPAWSRSVYFATDTCYVLAPRGANRHEHSSDDAVSKMSPRLRATEVVFRALESIAKRIVVDRFLVFDPWSDDGRSDETRGIETSCFVRQIAEKLGALRIVRGLIGDRPKDHRSLVPVAANHLAEHGLGLPAHLGLAE